jgi:phosphoesterase RecJ-like protein
MQRLTEQIKAAKRIILTTHKQCDGDGLGAELAIFFALKKLGKEVFVINVDPTPKKYNYLEPAKWIQYFEENSKVPENIDLTLIFDTNDERLVQPLFDSLKKVSRVIAFVDHHPILIKGPSPTQESYIDTLAASTGELAYRIIKSLGITIDQEVAICLYTSIVFDTQLFRYIRASANSHLIAAELILTGIRPEKIHKSLFGNQTVQKMAFLAKTLGQIEYFCEGKLAVLRLRDKDLFHYNLEPDDSRDVVDMVMNIESLEAAALFREDGSNEFKLSLRSKGGIEVLPVAEAFGGGGHIYAAGAFLTGDFEHFKLSIVEQIKKRLNDQRKITA